MARVKEAFRRVRWSDGRLVSYRQDRVALGLHLWSQASGITVTVLWIISSSWAAWWVLIPMSIAHGVGLELVARNRLRRVALRVEVLGSDRKAQVKARLMDPLSRLDDYVIRYCDRSAEKFMTRARAARTRGDQESEAKCLRRAERERRHGQWYERTVERYGRLF